MPSIFPGMDPYLERPALWSGVHHRLITAIANDLAPQIRPKYIVAIEEHVYQTIGEQSLLLGVPDVSVHGPQRASNATESNVAVAAPRTQPIEVQVPMPEILTEGYLEIREVDSGEVITVIEILSPKNKKSGVGRQQYENKRQLILGSDTHLVEIDLLRQGKPMPVLSNVIKNSSTGENISSYRILVSRSNRRPKAELYAFNLQDVIPTFTVPLAPQEPEPVVDLQSLFSEIYDLGGYDLRIDYSRKLVPALSTTDAAWADRLLRDRGLR